MPPMLHHDTVAPDIETASDDYARRFDGPAGRFLLDAQTAALVRLLQLRPGGAGLRVLEVGGGHAQLTRLFLRHGFEVWVQGSAPSCARRVMPMRADFPDRLHFVTSGLLALPFPDDSFDLVVAIRLLAHIEKWEVALSEMARVCRHRLVIDYPPLASINLLEPILFKAKRRLEGNTRPYFCYTTGRLVRVLKDLGFERFSEEKQFFFPMVLHRRLKRPSLSQRLEGGSRALGLTRLLGSPSLLLGEKASPDRSPPSRSAVGAAP